jgi:hypothetical protein
MDLETAIGYLAALAVPLWLLVEQVVSWRRPAGRVEKQTQADRLPGKPAASPAVKGGRVHAMRLADPRKTA